MGKQMKDLHNQSMDDPAYREVYAALDDDYTRAPIRKVCRTKLAPMPAMAELAKHYAAKITNVKPAQRDMRVGSIAPRRIGGKYG